ncbi:glyoxalase/bleomycin resistance/extradiol dioxygenase family protein [Maribacter sp. MJ134]|uniref:glyoxalase superfamily protein n=1 Tax=unclassified Maribacter TaxID=2615042 RepID=UPI000C157780|nr:MULTISPECIES: glyoxalase superfamily protein [unclassified Maribacter]AZQ57784.1 glyoxalase/bleomycin resistance/extradiol dioxygenase family protein [Maribacter sp. MJ134]PIB28319.1 bleomycin resistance protein [Maribacter sp. 4U21]
MERKGFLHQIHPVLPVRDVVHALDFYVNRLGFKIAFADDSKKPTYAGVLRDDIEIHLQWHDAKEWELNGDRPMLRIVTQNIEALYEEYSEKSVFNAHTLLRETAWGTKEFAFYDPDNNGLTFYRDA